MHFIKDFEQTKKDLIKLFRSNKPIFIARLGGNETDLVRRYIILKNLVGNEENNTNKLIEQLNKDKEFIDLSKSIKKYAGFYDTKNDINNIIKFCELYIKGCKNCDATSFSNAFLLSYYFYDSSWQYYVNNNTKDQYDTMISVIYKNNINIYDYTFFESVMPFLETFRYIAKDKKILILNSFSESIELQKKQLNKLINNYRFPNCTIITYKTPITYNENGKPFMSFPHNDFFETIENIQNDIKVIDFDIALLSCGAYSMFLGSFIKDTGKQAIYIGGILQIYFGIMGSRFKTSFFESFLNKQTMLNEPVEKNQIIKNAMQNFDKNEGFSAYF